MEHTENNKNYRLLFKILSTTALSTALLMTGFEILKQYIHAEITIWESHIATIIFTTIVSILLTELAIRKHYSVLRILTGFIPICAWCRKIRDKNGNWISFEEYIGKHSSAELTHGICPVCEKDFVERKRMSPHS